MPRPHIITTEDLRIASHGHTENIHDLQELDLVSAQVGEKSYTGVFILEEKESTFLRDKHNSYKLLYVDSNGKIQKLNLGTQKSSLALSYVRPDYDTMEVLLREQDTYDKTCTGDLYRDNLRKELKSRIMDLSNKTQMLNQHNGQYLYQCAQLAQDDDGQEYDPHTRSILINRANHAEFSAYQHPVGFYNAKDYKPQSVLGTALYLFSIPRSDHYYVQSDLTRPETERPEMVKLTDNNIFQIGQDKAVEAAPLEEKPADIIADRNSALAGNRQMQQTCRKLREENSALTQDKAELISLRRENRLLRNQIATQKEATTCEANVSTPLPPQSTTRNQTSPLTTYGISFAGLLVISSLVTSRYEAAIIASAGTALFAIANNAQELFDSAKQRLTAQSATNTSPGEISIG